jgi:uncharacterized protein (TIGR02646 family)
VKHVARGAEPHELINWKRENKALLDGLDFDDCPKAAVKLALLQNQGWLCAYTMLALRLEAGAHIEHALPQSTNKERRFDFDNLLACYPANGGDTSLGFGAPQKSNRSVNTDNFVFPRDPTCERRFNYFPNGNVDGLDAAAISTVIILNLNNENLRAKRLAAIGGLGLTNRPTPQGSPRRKMASAAEARRLAASVLRRQPNGRFEEFCIPISQIANAYADKMELKAGRTKKQRPRA